MTSSRPTELAIPAVPEPALFVKGEAILYRLYDVGYAIRLDRAFQMLSSNAPERRRPVQEGAATIQIPNPPVTVSLGTTTCELCGEQREVEFSARIFDFGLVSIRARLPVSADLPWQAFTAFGAAVAGDLGWTARFDEARRSLCDRISAAIEKPGNSAVTEEYLVFRVRSLCDGDNNRLQVSALRDADIAQLLLGEPRPVSEAARAELLSRRYSYFEDDLTTLTWYAALVVEDEPGESAVEYMLEFANAQLLELRFYDAILDNELPLMNARILQARRRFSRLLADLQTLVSDATDTVERIENSFKVTDDVFLGRVYAAALEIFGGRAWRRGIDRKLETLRSTYIMLNAEAQALRSEVLEITVILLILAEIVLAMFRS